MFCRMSQPCSPSLGIGSMNDGEHVDLCSVYKYKVYTHSRASFRFYRHSVAHRSSQALPSSNTIETASGEQTIYNSDVISPSGCQ